MFKNCTVSLALIGSVFLSACSSELASVSPRQAASMVASKEAIILDVRELDEWQAQHITGAIHIPLAQVEQRLSELAQYKHSSVIVQCRSGKRSAKAAIKLQMAGFTQVYNLTGGINAWVSDGLQTAQTRL
ncbi:MAG: rhodanese-like domain-containing protein [Betaproteobacteria bacterium]|nr:rhodanese-like domain-containing protein [Betaproteobacteria bacterium]